MPSVKLKFIVSSSASEQGFEAENLLVEGRSRTKWKGKAGSTTNSVVIQLDRECPIHAIDIGNEFSALVEILVAKSCETQPTFHTLVPSSSLMDPMESRSEKNGNRVRMFTDLDMIPAIEKQKWDMIKIVCSQPFNPNIAYGLAFVNVIAEESEGKGKEDTKVTLPKLSLTQRNKKDNGDLMKAGGLFRQRYLMQNHSVPEANGITSNSREDPESGTTEARKRVNVYSNVGDGDKAKRSKEDGEGSSDDKRPSPLPNGGNVSKEEPKRPVMAQTSGDGHTPSPGPAASQDKRKVEDVNDDNKKGEPKRPNAKKIKLKPQVPRATTPPPNDVPFNQVLRGVRFSLSGYQNPKRSQLRDKARQMGAVYEADWTSSCTHLICAFPNTPKWRQVGTRGVIVNDKWIDMCHMRKKRLPEKNFPVV